MACLRCAVVIMLWAALFFPELAINMASTDAHAHDSAHDSANIADPLAIIVPEGAKRLLMSCNSAARELGLHPGLTLNSAYAICPDLNTLDYDEQRQQQHIEQLSLWAMQYSSWVTPFMPNTIMLEVEASLSLFGDLPTLLSRIEQSCDGLGLSVQIGVAPTPSAARLLSRLGSRLESHPESQLAHLVILKPEDLQKKLAPIAIEFLPLDAFTLKGLRQSGIKRCDQLFTLPAKALTRRFGQDCTALVCKLLGKLPEPCEAFKAPERFTHSLDLPLEAPDTNALQFSLNRLLNALGGFLKTTDLGVKTLYIILKHHRLPPSRVRLSFLEATADHKHLLKIATEKLSATQLAAPVIAITIDAAELGSVERSGKDLFNKSQSQTGSIQQALDLLSARLGPDQVFTPILREDHRPEKAPQKMLQKISDATTHDNTAEASWPARPLWLLKEPVTTSKQLILKSTAERIENGWWCDEDVRRDYYLAEDEDGIWYWVYQLRQSAIHRSASNNKVAASTLYIHGLFA